MNAFRYVGLIATVTTAVPSAVAAYQVDTVRVGGAALRDAQLRTGTSTLESFQRADGRDVQISVTTQTITRERRGDLDVYLIHTSHAPSEGDTTVGVIAVRASDFALRHHRVKAAGDSAAVTVADGYLTGWVALPGESPRLIDQRLDGPVFPIEGQIPWLFPLLPLAEGYAAAIPHYSEWEAGETWSTVRVVGDELLTADGRERDCWKVDGGELFPGYQVTYWVDKSTRRVVQGVARGGQGGPEFWSRARTR